MIAEDSTWLGVRVFGNGAMVTKIKCFLVVVMFLLLSPVVLLGAPVAPLITAKNGILYKDGKACFLPGVVCSGGALDPGLWLHRGRGGSIDIVPGKKGNGVKVSFEKVQKRTKTSCDFIEPPENVTPGMNPSVWVKKKHKFLKFWIKGDGSKNVVEFWVRNWVQWMKKDTMAKCIGKVSLRDRDWKEVVIPLENKYEILAKTNYPNLMCGGTAEAFHFVLDEMTITGDEEEIVLYDFEPETASRIWGLWAQRQDFEDDPVYRAIQDDPLYREVSRKSLGTIGVASCHSSLSKEFVKDLIPVERIRGLAGEAYLCKQLEGLPMVPGFSFSWVYHGGTRGEQNAKRWGIPPTALHRNPDGSVLGGFMSLSFEDPFGRKVFKEYWQRGARYLLENDANIYAYELVNENSGFFNDAHQNNRELFVHRLKEKHKDISVLNKVWGTYYKSFAEVINRISDLGGYRTKRIKGLGVEWQKFMEDRYVEILQQGAEWIHEVEDELGKPNALMGQMGGAHWEFLGLGGTDLYKMARGLDVIETEFGIGFGTKYDLGEVTPQTLVIASREKLMYLMCADVADAVSGNKPIINTEHYVYRYRGDYRQHTTKADVITSLWEEFLRGVSAVHTFEWDMVYASKEVALARGGSKLLSPHLYPRESLNGYKEVQEEIARAADVLMDRPRLGRNAAVAVLFSRPTARYLRGVPGWIKDHEKINIFERSHLNLYRYLLDNHYPMRYLYEEQLPGENVNKYKVILVPHSDNIYPGTLKYLTDYVRKGGLLVCFGSAFGFDEYGNEKDNTRLIGLQQKKVNTFAKRVNLGAFGSTKAISRRELVPVTAKVLVPLPRTESAFITVNAIGKGKVYCINADTFRLDNNLIDPIMGYVMDTVDISPPLNITSLDGKKQANVEAHLIEKGLKKVIFVVNWLPYEDRVVKLRLNDVRDKDKYYLVDIAKNSIYTREGTPILTGKVLREGINLYLPEEERVVLLLTKDRYRLSNKYVKLMSDEEARRLERDLKQQVETPLEQSGISSKVVFYVTRCTTNEEMKKYVKSLARESLKKIKLFAADKYFQQIIYVLTYDPSLTKEEVESIQNKMLNALVEKALLVNYEVITIDAGKCKKKADEAASYTAELYKNATVSNCKPLDISKQANMG